MIFIFYSITIFCIAFTFQNLFGQEDTINIEKLIGFFIIILYMFAYYCLHEHKKHVLKTYYVEKDLDTREPDVALIEDTLHSFGYTDYKCEPENVDITQYSEEDIKKAIIFYNKWSEHLRM